MTRRSIQAGRQPAAEQQAATAAGASAGKPACVSAVVPAWRPTQQSWQAHWLSGSSWKCGSEASFLSPSSRTSMYCRASRRDRRQGTGRAPWQLGWEGGKEGRTPAAGRATNERSDRRVHGRCLHGCMPPPASPALHPHLHVLVAPRRPNRQRLCQLLRGHALHLGCFPAGRSRGACGGWGFRGWRGMGGVGREARLHLGHSSWQSS